MNINKRIFVSFDEYCPFECKHCYTYDIERSYCRTVDEIVESISDEDFDVVYVSQKNDNFANPERGIALCEKLFDRYGCNIFAITRNTFDTLEIERVRELYTRMRTANKLLVFAVSVSAIQSAYKTEDLMRVPSPDSRIAFISRLSASGIPIMAMIRPVYPEKIVPSRELFQIVDLCRSHASCVVSSGLGVNGTILNRLGMKREDFTYIKDFEYLQGAIDCSIDFIDVRDELARLHAKCEDAALPFFEHSMPALNHLYEQVFSCSAG